MNHRLELALSSFALGRLTESSLPAVASGALDDGVDSPSLRVLAGLENGHWQDIRSYFAKSLAELDITVPSRERAATLLMKDCARQIVEGSLSPSLGARAIVEILWELDAPPEHTHWIAVESDLADFHQLRVHDPAHYDRLIAKAESDIRQYAQALVDAIAA